jgi:site-specific recombinase XerD
MKSNGRSVKLATVSGNRGPTAPGYPALSVATSPTTGQDLTVETCCQAYLVAAQAKLNPVTLKNRSIVIADFVRALGSKRVGDLTPSDVADWLAAHDWNASTRQTRAKNVHAIFRWCQRTAKLIGNNPVSGIAVELKQPLLREAWFDDKQQADLLAACDEHFRQFLLVLLATGARPFSELARVTAASVVECPEGLQLRCGPRTRTKGTRAGRLVYVPRSTATMIRKLAKQFPKGPLFRNSHGNRWSAAACAGRLARLRKRLAWLTDKHNTYSCRHSFATTKLSRNVSLATVALLLGNSIAITQKHYGHLERQTDNLWAAIEA